MPFDSLPEPNLPFDPVAALLAEARGLIANHGWCQRAMINETGVCTVGAIRIAVDRLAEPLDQRRRLYARAIARFAAALPARCQRRFTMVFVGGKGLRRYSALGSIIMWNDRKSRTRRQVLAQFDKVVVLQPSSM
jgi:hypothetical protein